MAALSRRDGRSARDRMPRPGEVLACVAGWRAAGRGGAPARVGARTNLARVHRPQQARGVLRLRVALPITRSQTTQCRMKKKKSGKILSLLENRKSLRRRSWDPHSRAARTSRGSAVTSANASWRVPDRLPPGLPPFVSGSGGGEGGQCCPRTRVVKTTKHGHRATATVTCRKRGFTVGPESHPFMCLAPFYGPN